SARNRCSAVASMVARVIAFLRSRRPASAAGRTEVPFIELRPSYALFGEVPDPKVDPQLHTGKAEVNGASLYYEQRGEGPSLLFIPCGSVDAWHYAAVTEILARDFRVVTYDRRGNGRSPRPP